MRRRTLLRAVLASPLLALPAATRAAGGLLVGVGDSLTWRDGYLLILSRWFGWPVYNVATDGTLIVDQAIQWLDVPAGLVVSLCGYNDMRTFGANPNHLAAYEATLLGCLFRAARRGPVAVGGCLPPPPTIADTSAAYSAIVARCAAQAGALYVDLSGYDPERYTIPGDIHPSPAGHQWIADRFIATLGTIHLPAVAR